MWMLIAKYTYYFNKLSYDITSNSEIIHLIIFFNYVVKRLLLNVSS